VALDSGARKGELCGLRWEDVDFEANRIRIVQQLMKPGPEPLFGSTKTEIALSPDTMDLLKAHRRTQAERKMANRTTYHDFGLVFAMTYDDLTIDAIGLGCRSRRTTWGIASSSG
jgi:integrase